MTLYCEVEERKEMNRVSALMQLFDGGINWYRRIITDYDTADEAIRRYYELMECALRKTRCNVYNYYTEKYEKWKIVGEIVLECREDI